MGIRNRLTFFIFAVTLFLTSAAGTASAGILYLSLSVTSLWTVDFEIPKTAAVSLTVALCSVMY